MKIDASALSFTSRHHASVREERSERLDVWAGGQRAAAATTQISGEASTRVAISESARLRLSWETTAPAIANGAQAPTGTDITTTDATLSVLKSVIEMFTGEAVKVFSAADLPRLRDMPALAAPSSARNGGGVGAAYEMHHVREEHETLDFAAEGVVRTADGQEIRFKLDLAFERHVREEQHVSVRVGAPPPRKDPLVVNFGGSADLLTDTLFRFDLDGDGRSEWLPGLSGGTGFLVFDRNGNGKVDNGSELFGPRTDNGFAELALLDTDGNGWVDGGDADFARLGVWRPGATIAAVAQAGIAALATDHADTPFALHGTSGRPLGQIAESGVFLDTAGRAGALHDLDLNIFRSRP